MLIRASSGSGGGGASGTRYECYSPDLNSRVYVSKNGERVDYWSYSETKTYDDENITISGYPSGGVPYRNFTFKKACNVLIDRASTPTAYAAGTTLSNQVNNVVFVEFP